MAYQLNRQRDVRDVRGVQGVRVTPSSIDLHKLVPSCCFGAVRETHRVAFWRPHRVVLSKQLEQLQPTEHQTPSHSCPAYRGEGEPFGPNPTFWGC